MKYVRKFYTFQSLLKNVKLLPADNSADSFIKNNLWLQDWNFFYGKTEIFDFKKTPFRYVFSVAINVFLCDCIAKGACIKRMGAVRNYSTNTIMEKTDREGS